VLLQTVPCCLAVLPRPVILLNKVDQLAAHASAAKLPPLPLSKGRKAPKGASVLASFS
jgi:hypothetical protein